MTSLLVAAPTQMNVIGKLQIMAEWGAMIQEWFDMQVGQPSKERSTHYLLVCVLTAFW
jgi:hypothetical protein